MEYLEDSKELKVAVDSIILQVKTQITVLLLFCKNPEINKHVESVKIPKSTIWN